MLLGVGFIALQLQFPGPFHCEMHTERLSVTSLVLGENPNEKGPNRPWINLKASLTRNELMLQAYDRVVAIRASSL